MKVVYTQRVKNDWFKEQNDERKLVHINLKVDFQVYKIPVAPIPPPD